MNYTINEVPVEVNDDGVYLTINNIIVSIFPNANGLEVISRNTGTYLKAEDVNEFTIYIKIKNRYH